MKLTILLAMFILASLSQTVDATVTLAPRQSTPFGLYLHNQYGNVTVTNQQIINSLTMYANGTIYIDLRNVERVTGTFTYLVQSYGNGTLQLRFASSQVPIVTAKLATSQAFVNEASWEQVTYSSNVASDPLILDFFGLASPNIANAAVGLSAFVILIVLATALGTTGGFVTIFTQVLTGETTVQVASQDLKRLLQSDLEASMFGRVIHLPMMGLAALIALLLIIAVSAAVYGILQGMGL